MSVFANNARNVNGALRDGLMWLLTAGQREESRNGPVLVSPSPVMTTYQNPDERVLFGARRDANPFFHLMEGLWMLAGRRDGAWIAKYNARMLQFSDDGETLNGAYGHRWRSYHYGIDQLEAVVKLLQDDPTTRRAVLTMWSPRDLINQTSRDLPCNTQVYFRVREESVLDALVTARSNDAIWGAHGANAVHFSMLLEFVASAAGLMMGQLQQLSYNYHAYTELEGYPVRLLEKEVLLSDHDDRYASDPDMTPCALFTGMASDDWRSWLGGLNYWMNQPFNTAGIPFLQQVAAPVHRTWEAYKVKGVDAALEACYDIEAADWHVACREWLERRAG